MASTDVSLLPAHKGMGILRSRLNPTAPLPILGAAVAAAAAAAARAFWSVWVRHVHLYAVFLASFIAWRYAELAWKKPRLEAAIRQYDEEIDSIKELSRLQQKRSE